MSVSPPVTRSPGRQPPPRRPASARRRPVAEVQLPLPGLPPASSARSAPTSPLVDVDFAAITEALLAPADATLGGVARRLGCSVATVRALRGGRVPRPRLRATLVVVARQLDPVRASRDWRAPPVRPEDVRWPRRRQPWQTVHAYLRLEGQRDVPALCVDAPVWQVGAAAPTRPTSGNRVCPACAAASAALPGASSIEGGLARSSTERAASGGGGR